PRPADGCRLPLSPCRSRPFSLRPSSSALITSVTVLRGSSMLSAYFEPQHTPRAAPLTGATLDQYESGGVLLSHTVTHAVPSALEGLTSGFGMEPGVSPPP